VLSYILKGEAATLELGARLSPLMPAGSILLLDGPLGSGKTTLVRGLARGLGLSREYDVVSPTFTLLNLYPTPIPLYHADCYRLSPLEAEELDLPEQARNGILAVEWPENAALDIPRALRLRLDYAGPDARRADILAASPISDKIKKMMEMSPDFVSV
jgi:tRNA threonylcarbamoyl adenosine modification protein YjeE